MLHETIINSGKEIINRGKRIISSLNKKIKKSSENFNINKENLEFDISIKQFKILRKLIKSVKTRTDVKNRARIIVKCYFDKNISRCSRELKTTRKTVCKCKIKWTIQQNILIKTEIEEVHKLKQVIIMVLSDDYRVGRPPIIKSEQVAAIIYLSLQEPLSFGLPVSHWTAERLRDKATKLEIVKEISSRQINRYLKRLDINIYRYEQWLNSVESNPDFEKYMEKVKNVCEIYVNSHEYLKKGIVIVSTDEKTGIQAIEHKHPAKPI